MAESSNIREKLTSFLKALHSNLNRQGGFTFASFEEETNDQEVSNSSPLETSKIAEFLCSNGCKKSFNTKKLLNIHEKSCQAQQKTLCDVCGALILVKRQKEHMRRHKVDRPYQCDKCPKTFKENSQLQRHQQTCHVSVPILFYCDYCNKALKCKKALRKHLHQYHVPEKALKCEECNRPFGDKARLKRHYIVHKRERNEFIEVTKNFKCPECGKLFATNTHLKQHSGVHSGLKSFICSLCQQGFNFFSSMRNHERNVHGKTKKHGVVERGKKIEVAAYAEVSSAAAVQPDVTPVLGQGVVLTENNSIVYYFK